MHGPELVGDRVAGRAVKRSQVNVPNSSLHLEERDQVSGSEVQGRPRCPVTLLKDQGLVGWNLDGTERFAEPVEPAAHGKTRRCGVRNDDISRPGLV
jgi:hypothetical protein